MVGRRLQRRPRFRAPGDFRQLRVGTHHPLRKTGPRRRYRHAGGRHRHGHPHPDASDNHRRLGPQGVDRPNKEFITGQLVNWTLSDTILRVVVPIGIAYGSDVSLARSLLLKVARENPTVMDNPEPTAIFARFGDSALEFELRAFIPNSRAYLTVRDELNSAVEAEFRKAGIEIPFHNATSTSARFRPTFLSPLRGEKPRTTGSSQF